MTAARDWSLIPVLWGSTHYNYSVRHLRDPIDDFAEHIGEEDADGRPDFLFLGIPSLERDTAPLHGVLVGHELGHLRDWYLGVSGSWQIETPAEFLDASGNLLLDTYSDAEAFNTIAANWLSEIVADLFSAQLFGPASLLALPDLAATSGPMNIDLVSHPGIDRRLSVVKAELIVQGFDDIPAVHELLESFTFESDPFARPVQFSEGRTSRGAQLAWDSIREQIGDIARRCRDLLPDGDALDPVEWDIVEFAANLLAHGNPCGEMPTGDGSVVPTRIEVILNAAWFVRMNLMNLLAAELGADDSTLDGIIRTDQVLDGLTLKSIEISAYRGDNPWQ